jgi:hypothetical protein
MRIYQRSDGYGLGLLVFVILCLVGGICFAGQRYWYVMVPLLLLALVGAYIQWGRRERAGQLHDTEHTDNARDGSCRWCHREYRQSQAREERDQIAELARERLRAKYPSPDGESGEAIE